MRIAKEDVNVQMQIPGATLRLQKGFGDVRGYDAISAEFFSLKEGVDTTPLFIGLEGDMCQCPHWGYVIAGRITTTDAGGVNETVTSGDLFYWPPGHNVRIDEDAEFVMFSPQREHIHVIDHMQAKVEEG
ncbi:MAG: cupin domain-containing protein [Planctomycetota bacterium]